jgi:hypothetical protein
VVFKVEPRTRRGLQPATGKANIALRLVIRIPEDDDYSRMIKHLSALSGINAIQTTLDGQTLVSVSGNPSADEIGRIARKINPDPEVIALDPKWRDGLLGVMQLFVLEKVGQMASQRLVSRT